MPRNSVVSNVGGGRSREQSLKSLNWTTRKEFVSRLALRDDLSFPCSYCGGSETGSCGCFPISMYQQV